MEMVVALVLLHVSVDDCPAMIEAGAAEKVRVGAGCVTVTVTEAVAVPPGPVAVAVYVVVAVGTTGALPESGRGWESSCDGAGLIVTVAAAVLAHVSVLNWPEATVLGEAVRVMVGLTAGMATVTVAVAVAVPPGPVAVAV